MIASSTAVCDTCDTSTCSCSHVRTPAYTRMSGNSSKCRKCRNPCAADMETLARAVACLSPSHRDPEAFHIGKSEIIAELRRLARVLA